MTRVAKNPTLAIEHGIHSITDNLKTTLFHLTDEISVPHQYGAALGFSGQPQRPTHYQSNKVN
jgi:hypothetical protein